MTPISSSNTINNVTINPLRKYFINKPSSIVCSLFHKIYSAGDYVFQKTIPLLPTIKFIICYCSLEGFTLILKELPTENLSKTHQIALKVTSLALNIIKIKIMFLGIKDLVTNFKIPQIGNKSLLPPAKDPLNISQKTFADMEGMEDLKEQLKFVIESWTNKTAFEGYEIISPTNGVIFYGPPGAGKTLAAECLAGEMKLPFYKFSVGDITSRYMGNTAVNINELFTDIKKRGGGVIFLDEIESLVPKRNDSNNSNVATENNKTIGELLVQLQNASPSILVVAATNHLGSIDPAIIRSGRFDLKIEIPLPDAKARTALLKLYLSKNTKLKIITEDIYQKLGERLEGCSPSDIKSIVQESAFLAMRNNQAYINVDHIKAILERRSIKT